MISPDGIGDLESAAEEEKRYCQSELEKLDERRRQVLIDLGAAVAEHEKGNPAFWADYPAESKALSDVEDQLDVLEARIADADKAIEQENNRKESDQIKELSLDEALLLRGRMPGAGEILSELRFAILRGGRFHSRYCSIGGARSQVP